MHLPNWLILVLVRVLFYPSQNHPGYEEQASDQIRDLKQRNDVLFGKKETNSTNAYQNSLDLEK